MSEPVWSSTSKLLNFLRRFLTGYGSGEEPVVPQPLGAGVELKDSVVSFSCRIRKDRVDTFMKELVVFVSDGEFGLEVG
jgi:hypothetical protein